jgi:glycosyltransferase involved in cell wall biosynthesis
MRSLRVAMTGLRGFPQVQGGVEAHAEHLCPLLHDAGCNVNVMTRKAYMSPDTGNTWNGIKFRSLPAPQSKYLEAITHTFLSVLYAGVILRPDVLHIQAIGPALMAPLARLFGLRVVVTHHGQDYNRKKWGPFAKWVLRKGEFWGLCFAHRRIVISETIRALIEEKYGLESDLIPNGVTLPELPDTTGALEQFGLTSGRYVLLVSRLVPEKRHLDLIAGFLAAGLDGWKLVLVGASDHPDEYKRQLLDVAGRTPNVVTTGFQTGLALRELYAHAGLFVLPSCHEGLPIAMLEALSFGLPVVASDIPANLEVGLPATNYFPLGDVEQLAQRLREFATRPIDPAAREQTRRWVVGKFDWRQIAEQTLAVYRLACLH